MQQSKYSRARGFRWLIVSILGLSVTGVLFWMHYGQVFPAEGRVLWNDDGRMYRVESIFEKIGFTWGQQSNDDHFDHAPRLGSPEQPDPSGNTSASIDLSASEATAAAAEAPQTASESAQAHEREPSRPETRLYEVHYNSYLTVPYRKSAKVIASIASFDRSAAQRIVARADGKTAVGKGRFTGVVRAALTGPSDLVSITADGTDEKMLERGSNATWSWYVVPKVRDKVELNLRFFNVIDEAGKERTMDGEAFATTIVVDPGFLGFVMQQIVDGSDLYPFIGILVSVAGLLIAALNFKRAATHSPTPVTPVMPAPPPLASAKSKPTRKPRRTAPPPPDKIS